MINANLWGVFHDGNIISVSGKIPGDLDIIIELEYVRRQFPDAGNAFRMHLIGCDMLSFKSFSTNEKVLGVEAVTGQELEILSAKLDGDELHVITSNGVLCIHYLSECLFLDSGRELQMSDVATAANIAFAKFRHPNN